MPFVITPLADLAARARSAFRSYLPGTDAWLWPNNLNPSAKVIAGTGYELFGALDYVARQKFAGTADGESLDLHGQEYGLARKAPSPAGGQIVVTAGGAIEVAGGAVLVRGDGAVQYKIGAGGSLSAAGSLTLDATATSNGKNTNANGGSPLTFVSGLTDVSAAGAITAAVGDAGLVGGFDVEPDGEFWTTDLNTFRGRILFRKRNPSQGGAPADYVDWASRVSGVSRVFVERRFNGTGTVRVFILMDDLYPNGIPSAGDVQRVQDLIDTLAPATASVTVAAPTALAVPLEITNLTPNTPDVQNAVVAELASAFRRLARPAGTDVVHASMPYLAYPTSFSRSWLWQAIANASGEERHIVTSPAADVAQAVAQMPVLGTVTFD